MAADPEIAAGLSGGRDPHIAEEFDSGREVRQGGYPRCERPSREPNAQGSGFVLIAQIIGLFALFYLYVLRRIHPELFFHQNPVLFLFDSRHFAGFMEQPGGPTEYASAFLSALFVYGWLGALVVTLLAALICLATRRFLAAVAGDGTDGLYLTPAVLILLLLGQYHHPVRLCAGLVLVLQCANAYVGIGNQPSKIRLLAFAVGSALVYFTAAGLYVVFACLCAVFELGVKRNRLLGWFCLLSAGALPAVAGVWLLNIGIEEAFRGLTLPETQDWLAKPSSMPLVMVIRVGLPLFLPVVAAAILWRRDGRLANEDLRPANAAAWHRPALGSAAVVLAALAADLAMFDFSTRSLLEIAASAEDGRWSDVLSHARLVPFSDARALDPRVATDVNRALHFRGRLLDEMFTYPQRLGAPSLTLIFENATATALRTPRQSSSVLLELGRVNESEHMAYEALEVLGNQPQILKRLVYIHVIKGEPEAARRYLSLLECSLLHRRWAQRCRRQLDADPTLSNVPAIADLRERMVTRDSVDDSADLETMLQGLLERNPRNRMATEYLLAHYLLTRQLDKLAANLHCLDVFGDSHLPRHCEEGLLIHLAAAGTRDLEAWEGRIRRATRQRFDRFLQTQGRFQYEAAAFAALEPEFGNTYFFAYTFGHSNPVAKHTEPLQ
ncbi:MAG: hypothetical protein GXY83_35210 [Rhodopirellula sp.]|nr:hypothetical protein [Rhodopirellula sp.]